MRAAISAIFSGSCSAPRGDDQPEELFNPAGEMISKRRAIQHGTGVWLNAAR